MDGLLPLATRPSNEERFKWTEREQEIGKQSFAGALLCI
jgi:hypothetical protein